MADAARAWLDGLDDDQRAAGGVAVPGRRRAAAVVLHADRPRRPAARGDGRRAAAGGDAAAARRSVGGGVRHGDDDHRARERARRRRALALDVRARARAATPGMYYVRVFGDPGPGAHVGLALRRPPRLGEPHGRRRRARRRRRRASSAPTRPHSPLLGPHLLRPLGGAEDLGRELVRSLDAGQLDRALISPVAPVDLVTANRPRVSRGRPAAAAAGDLPRRRSTASSASRWPRGQAAMEEAIGLRPEHLDARQPHGGARRGLRAAELRGAAARRCCASCSTSTSRRVPDELADAESAKYAADDDLDALCVRVGRRARARQPHYYRVQGARLLAEYDNTQRGVNHVHTVWRDLDDDFGGDVLAAPLRPRPPLTDAPLRRAPSAAAGCSSRHHLAAPAASRRAGGRRPRRAALDRPGDASSCRCGPASTRSPSPTSRTPCTSGARCCGCWRCAARCSSCRSTWPR